jgi:sugar transferase (PEP-CTERM/EpsH1 system associated)
MDILFVTAALPYPPTDGTRIRLFSLIKNLAKRHDISLVSFVTPTDRRESIDYLHGFCKNVRLVHRNSRYSISKLIWGVFGPTPFPILNYWDPAMAAAVNGLTQSTAFDIVQTEALHMAQYSLGLGGCRVLDLFDIQSVVMRRYADHQCHIGKRLYAQVTARKLTRYEHMISPQFTHCLTASPVDRDFMQKQVGISEVSVIPNGVDLDAYPPSRTRPASEKRIVFIGRMDYTANVDGIMWFCRHVLPLVRVHRPDTLLQIVGKYPTEEVKQLGLPGRVEVTGFVNDVRPYLEAAAVSIIPLRVGGGTRLKILEGLAMGIPIVSTSVGAEGLEVTPGKDILIADDAHGFAQHVVQILEDMELRDNLGRAGRQLVEDHYGWNMIAQRLETLYESLLREASRAEF